MGSTLILLGLFFVTLFLINRADCGKLSGADSLALMTAVGSLYLVRATNSESQDRNLCRINLILPMPDNLLKMKVKIAYFNFFLDISRILL